jgi:diketogulonate reductase-like aldo/keto reductase
MSGGCNHIDTSSTFRRHRSEIIVGQAIKALIRKYGLKRQEIFINSKQGFISEDEFYQEPIDL